MAITKFKAACLSVVEDVQRTGVPVRITRGGIPVADVVPIADPGPAEAVPRTTSWIGAMEGSGEIVGDIVGPIMAFGEWDYSVRSAFIGSTREARKAGR